MNSSVQTNTVLYVSGVGLGMLDTLESLGDNVYRANGAILIDAEDLIDYVPLGSPRWKDFKQIFQLIAKHYPAWVHITK